MSNENMIVLDEQSNAKKRKVTVAGVEMAWDESVKLKTALVNYPLASLGMDIRDNNLTLSEFMDKYPDNEPETYRKAQREFDRAIQVMFPNKFKTEAEAKFLNRYEDEREKLEELFEDEDADIKQKIKLMEMKRKYTKDEIEFASRVKLVSSQSEIDLNRVMHFLDFVMDKWRELSMLSSKMDSISSKDIRDKAKSVFDEMRKYKIHEIKYDD